MTEQEQLTWIEEEQNALGKQGEMNFEKRPALKLQQNKITEVTIDFSKPFDKYTTTNMKGDNVIKAIIPVTSNGEKLNFWLNKKNPIYREILAEGKGKKEVALKIMQTGQQEKTRYVIVK